MLSFPTIPNLAACAFESQSRPFYASVGACLPEYKGNNVKTSVRKGRAYMDFLGRFNTILKWAEGRPSAYNATHSMVLMAFALRHVSPGDSLSLFSAIHEGMEMRSDYLVQVTFCSVIFRMESRFNLAGVRRYITWIIFRPHCHVGEDLLSSPEDNLRRRCIE